MSRNARLALVLTRRARCRGRGQLVIYRVVAAIPVREVEVASLQAVVAAKPIPVGTIVTADHVKLVPWPARNPVPGSFTTIDKVVNRGAIVEVAENEPLTEAKLAPLGAGGGLPPTIPEGMRAISVKTNEVVGVAGFVIPGTRVDVLVTVRKGAAGRADFAGGREQRAGADRGLAIRSGEGEGGRQADPGHGRDAARHARPAPSASRSRPTKGQITLTLRNPLDVAATNDHRREDGEPAGDAGAAGRAQARRRTTGRREGAGACAAPPPPAPKIYTVEAIRAAKRSEETVK